jgi:transketolase
VRRAFADALFAGASADPRLIFLTGDLGFGVFDAFKERFGPRYVNVGVAEAVLVQAAAGLAAEGWRPVAYSIASFLTGRAFEQIRICVSYPGHPVVLVGAGGGYTYANSGVTHHAGEDLALMSSLPGMTVVAPGDPSEVAQLLPQLLRLSGPSYIRVGRYGEPTYEALEPPVLGRARLLRPGERVAVFVAGDIAPEVRRAVDGLAADGPRPTVYQVHTVKPLDVETLASVAGRVDAIVAVEEHMPTGGLAAGLASWLAARPGSPRLVRLGAPDALALGNPGRETLRRRFGVDAESVAAAIRAAWASPASVGERL